MNAVSIALDLRVKRPERPIPEADFFKLSSEAAAVRYCCENSGLQDKTIAAEIHTDAATLSKAKAGQARLSDHQLAALEDLSGLRAVTVANLLMRGLDPRSVRKLETELERENRELREKLAAREIELDLIKRMWREMRS